MGNYQPQVGDVVVFNRAQYIVIHIRLKTSMARIGPCEERNIGGNTEYRQVGFGKWAAVSELCKARLRKRHAHILVTY